MFHTTRDHFWVALSLTVSCASVGIVGYFDPQSGSVYCISRGFTLLASSGNCTWLCLWNKITKQLAFLNISSTPSLKKLHKSWATLSIWIDLFIFFFVYLPYMKPIHTKYWLWPRRKFWHSPKEAYWVPILVQPNSSSLGLCQILSLLQKKF
jgi:hypothetical protein